VKLNLLDKKSLIESFFSLSMLNGLNILLPFVTLPYIWRVVGVEKYGVYVFILLLVQYCVIISAYGFNFSATKQVSQNRDDIKKLSEIFCSVIASRLLLAFCSLFILFATSFLYVKSRDEFLMLAWGVGIVFGDILVPVWLFQGVEKMRYLTVVNIISKGLFTVLIFVFIQQSSDYKYIILLNAFGYLTAGIISTVLVKRQFGISFFVPKRAEIKFQLREGAALFGASASIELYRNANIFLLRFFVSDAAVGLYAAAEKIIKGLQSVVAPVAQALFPHFSLKFGKRTLAENVGTIKRVALRIGGALLLLSVFTFCTAGLLSEILCGKEYSDNVILVKIMSPVIFFGGLNYILGYLGLVNMNRQKVFFKYVLTGGLVSILFVLVATYFLGNVAAAIALTLSEVVLLVMCVLYFLKLQKS
jgi:PST family polysaccharide transporter